MKTIYQQPMTTVATVELHQMIAASPVEDGFNKQTAPDLDGTITSGNLSRRSNVWEEEEEEEY